MDHPRLRWFATALLSVALLAGCVAKTASPGSSGATPKPPQLASPARPPAPPEPAATPTAPIQVTGLERVGYLGGNFVSGLAADGQRAYVGFGPELTILDFSDPARPARIGRLRLPDEVWDVALAGDRAYMAAGESGLCVVDVADPAEPVLVTTVPVPGGAYGVAVTGKRAYACARGCRILDISDPARPVEVGELDLAGPQRPAGTLVELAGGLAYMAYESHDGPGGTRIVDVSDPAQPALRGEVPGAADDVAPAGSYAYLLLPARVNSPPPAQDEPARLTVVDVSGPDEAVVVSTCEMGMWRDQRVAVDGRYVYTVYEAAFGGTSGVQIVDVADPASPVALGRLEGLTSPVTTIAVVGPYAYIGSAVGLLVVDISDPSAPKKVGDYQYMPGFGPSLSAHELAVADRYAYCAAGENGLVVVDASDPMEPRVAGAARTGGHAWDVALSGGYAYLADEYNGLRVIDVSDPRHPVEAGACDLPDLHEFFSGVAVAGTYAYVADGSVHGTEGTGLRVLDISDPGRPVEVAFLPLEFEIRDAWSPRAEDVAVGGGYAYLAAGTAGLRVIDVSDPALPREVGFYDTPGRAASLALDGRYVYLVDGDLRIVDVADPARPAEVGFFDIADTISQPHITVQGGYAYLSGDGLLVLDVSDPGAPVEVARSRAGRGGVAVVGDSVYALDGGLTIFRAP